MTKTYVYRFTPDCYQIWRGVNSFPCKMHNAVEAFSPKVLVDFLANYGVRDVPSNLQFGRFDVGSHIIVVKFPDCHNAYVYVTKKS